MNPMMITAIAYLIAEAAAAGVSIATIFAEARATGAVSDETWDGILADLDSEVAKWKAKHG